MSLFEQNRIFYHPKTFTSALQTNSKHPYLHSSVCFTSVHVFQGLFRLLGRLKLDVGVAFGQVWVDAVHGHVDHLDLAIDGEDLLDVFLQKHKAGIVLSLVLRAFQ